MAETSTEISSKQSKAGLVYGIYLLVLLMVSLPVILTHPILGFDDFALLEPLRRVFSFQDYISLWKQNLIYDMTPVRDLTYWLELRIESSTGYLNSQLVNLVFWFFTVIIFDRIMIKLKVSIQARYFLIFLIGLHPVFADTVFWIAGRKHLLSAFFMLLSFNAYLGWHENRAFRQLTWAVIFFLCCLLSHPINLGFPIFLFVFDLLRYNRENRAPLKFFVLLFLISLSIGFLVEQYFANFSYLNTGAIDVPKFINEKVDLVIKRFLVIGRFIFQLTLPVKPSVVSYNLFYWPSYVGLGVFTFLSFLVLKGRRKFWVWAVFIGLPIGVMTVKLTAQGGMDTYIFAPMLGLGFLIADRCQDFVRKYQSVVLVFPILFAMQDWRMANVFSSKAEFWSYAAFSEKSSFALVSYAKYLINEDKPDLLAVQNIIDELRESHRTNTGFGYVVGKWVYISPVNDKEKLLLFEKYQVPGAWYAYFKAGWLAQQQQFHEGFELIKTEWFRDPLRFFIDFQFNIEDLRSKWTQMCELAHEPDCKEVSVWINRQTQEMRFRKLVY